MKLLFVDYFFLSLDSSHFLSFISTLSTSSFLSFSLWRSNLTPNVLFHLILFHCFLFLSLSLLVLLTLFLFFSLLSFSPHRQIIYLVHSVTFIFLVSHFLCHFFFILSIYFSFLLFQLPPLSLPPLP